MWRITLTDADLADATATAKMAIAEAVSMNRNDYNARPMEKMLDDRVKGKMGEKAASRLLGVPATPSRARFVLRPDLINGAEVRATNYEHGVLYLYPRDKDDDDFILCIGEFPHYRLAGWINCARGKAIGKFSTRWQSHYEVEQHYLDTIEDLLAKWARDKERAVP